MKLSDNTILITGGGTGIGYSLADHLVSLGNKIIICGRREDKLKEAQLKLQGIIIRVCDLEKESERKSLAAWVAKEYPVVNILINNAGIQNGLSILTDLDLAGFRQEIEINFIAPVHLSNLFVPILKKNEDPAIINISSGLAFTPLAFLPIYCASKAALHSVTLSLRHQLLKTGIKVFEIAPPTVDTELDRGARESRGQTHRGISADEFTILALEALKNDVYEAAIGQAENLRANREEMFAMMNRPD